MAGLLQGLTSGREEEEEEGARPPQGWLVMAGKIRVFMTAASATQPLQAMAEYIKLTLPMSSYMRVDAALILTISMTVEHPLQH